MPLQHKVQGHGHLTLWTGPCKKHVRNIFCCQQHVAKVCQVSLQSGKKSGRRFLQKLFDTFKLHLEKIMSPKQCHEVSHHFRDFSSKADTRMNILSKLDKYLLWKVLTKKWCPCKVLFFLAAAWICLLCQYYKNRSLWY